MLILFSIAITTLIGFGLVDFKEYSTYLNLFVFQNFAQVVGLGLVIVKFLYYPSMK